MKLTKQRLKEIIEEELQVALTNDEAAELFGDQIKQQLNEFDGGVMDPNMVPRVPLRPSSRQELEDEPTEVDELYDITYNARMELDKLVNALQKPRYDREYELAHRSFVSVGEIMNHLKERGAKPDPEKETVAQAPGSKEDSEMRRLSFVGTGSPVGE